MKKWSGRYLGNEPDQLSSHIKSLVRKIRYLLRIISGDDITVMLKGTKTLVDELCNRLVTIVYL